MITMKPQTHFLRNLILELVLLSIMVVGPIDTLFAQAFPGAQGYGAQTTGGRGGQVIHVTNLNSSGPGSLNAAVQTSGPRIVVFDVGGQITGDVTITQPDLTIAGETAPAPGITINGRLWTDYNTSVKNIIVRFLRIRPDDLSGQTGDAVQFSLASDVILDHMNVSWGADETIDLYEAKNVTLQYCLIEESATFAGHPDGNFHNYGMINGPDGRNISVHHNLFAHHNHRTSAIANGPADIINNVIYNATTGFVHHNPANDDCFNFIGNYYKTGPDRGDINPFWLDDEIAPLNAQYYMNGNYVDDAIGPDTYQDFLDDPWNSTYEGVYLYNAVPGTVPTQCASTDIAIATAADAYTDVLANAGSFPRDVVANRTVTEVQNGTGSWGREVPSDLMAGLPNGSAPLDTDNDGMSDEWEINRGLNPNVADNNSNDDGDMYTNIEEYLHYRASLLLNTDPNPDPDPDTEAPSIPTGLNGVATSSSNINLNWNASTDNVGVVGYSVSRNGTEIASVAGTSYIDTGLNASTVYSYTISSLDAAGNKSSESSLVNITTDAASTGVLPSKIEALIPAQNATEVSTTTDLIIDLSGTVSPSQQYAGGVFQLYKLNNQDTPVFEYSFNTSGSGIWSGSDIITFDIPDLDPGTAYIVLAQYGWVRTSLGGAGGFRPEQNTWETNREVWKFTTAGDVPSDTQAPSIPSGLTDIGHTHENVQLSWTASTDNIGVTSYTMYRDGVSIATDILGTNYTDTTVSESTNYSYSVSASDLVGNESVLSDAITVTTDPIPDTEAPSVPTGLNATNTTTNSTVLGWNISTDNVGVTNYKVYRDGTEIAVVVDSNSYTDNGLSDSTTYVYTVSALDETGNESAQSSIVSVTTNTTPTGVLPSKIEALIPAQNATGVSTTTDLIIDLSGTVSPSQQYAGGVFQLYKLNNQDTPVFEYSFNTSGSGIWSGSDIIIFDIPDLDPGTVYIVLAQYGWVRTSLGGAGGFRPEQNIWETNREVWKFTTAGDVPSDTQAPTIPTGLNGAAITSSSCNLSWNASSDNVGVTSYTVYRDGIQIATSVLGTSYNDNALNESTTYNYSVTASDAAGNVSATSETYAITTLEDTTSPVPVSIITTTLSNGRVNQSYTATFTAQGGNSPYNWSITAGNLPVGLTLNSNSGTINGTPQNSGTYSFSVTVIDSGNPQGSASRNFNLFINPEIDPGDIQIKQEHPRIWLTDDRLAELQGKRSQNALDWQEFMDKANARAGDNDIRFIFVNSGLYPALAYAITKDDVYAREALRYLDLAFDIPYQNSNQYRWYGMSPLIIFDWIYDYIERQGRIQDFVGLFGTWSEYWMDHNIRYVDTDHTSSLVRNMMMTSITTWGDDQQAPAYMDFAMNSLWNYPEMGIMDFLINGLGKGGLWPEGSGYSIATAGYIFQTTLAYESATGINLLEGNSFAEDYIKATIHQTTPDEKHVITYNDVENNIPDLDYFPVSGGMHSNILMAINQTRYLNSIGYGAYWHKNISPAKAGIIEEFLFHNRDLTPVNYKNELDLNYFASGMGTMFTRTDWTPEATYVHFNGKGATVADHMHSHALSFDIMRKGVWITKEASGYTADETEFHNSILIENQRGGSQSPYRSEYEATIEKMNHTNEYSYIYNDATGLYNADPESYLPDLPAERVYREFVHLKPDLFVVYDYIKIKDDYNDRWKQFVLHTQNRPVINGNQYSDVRDGQKISVEVLIPENPQFTIHDESILYQDMEDWQIGDSQKNWQIRTEALVHTREERFLNVIQTSDASVGNMVKSNTVYADSNNMTGVHISNNSPDYVVLFSNNENAQEGVTYNLDSGTSVFHLICDLDPNQMYEVYQNGSLISSLNVNENGNLQFNSDQGGDFSIVQSGTNSLSSFSGKVANDVPVHIFPNPFTEELNVIVNSKPDANINFTIMNGLGRVYYTNSTVQKGEQGMYKLNFSDVPIESGMYFLMIQSDSFKKKVYQLVRE